MTRLLTYVLICSCEHRSLALAPSRSGSSVFVPAGSKVLETITLHSVPSILLFSQIVIKFFCRPTDIIFTFACENFRVIFALALCSLNNWNQNCSLNFTNGAVEVMLASGFELACSEYQNIHQFVAYGFIDGTVCAKRLLERIFHSSTDHAKVSVVVLFSHKRNCIIPFAINVRKPFWVSTDASNHGEDLCYFFTTRWFHGLPPEHKKQFLNPSDQQHEQGDPYSELVQIGWGHSEARLVFPLAGMSVLLSKMGVPNAVAITA